MMERETQERKKERGIRKDTHHGDVPKARRSRLVSRNRRMELDPEEPAGGEAKESCWSLYFLLKWCLRVPPPLQESSPPFC